jgi:predicted nucleic acid-binding protein
MNEFVDTNVLCYAYELGAGRKHEISVELLKRLFGDRTGWISTQVLVEFYSVATGKLRLGSQYTENVLNDFSSWHLHRPDHAAIISAVHLQRRYKLAWYDAMILNSALESGCSILWTEDFSDGQRFGDLVIRNPYKNARLV